MKRMLTRFVVVSIALFLPLAAHALQFRTYVASYGSDSNACGVSAPCRLLPAALAQTLDGGEIWILDSANFNSGTVNINKSVSIMAIPGQIGSIVSVAGAPAISITTASVTVRLRNLFIVDNANNHGTDGVNVAAATTSLTVDNCVFWVVNEAVVANGGGTTVTVMNSRILGAYNGVHIKGGALAEVVKSEFANLGQWGVFVDGSVASTTSVATVRDSSFTNMYLAVLAYSTVAGSTTKVHMTGSTVTNMNYGLFTEADAGNATSWAGGNTFANLTYGLVNFSSPAVTYSFGNNMNSSASGNYGTITAISQN